MTLSRLFKTAALATAIASTSSLALADDYHIGVTVPSADHGWTAGLLWWAQQAADDLSEQYPDVSFTVLSANSGTAQVSNVEDLMIRNLDALVILPHDPATLQAVISEAYDEGIYTVVVDRELETPAQNVFIAGDNPGLGEHAARYIAEELGGEGNILVLEGPPIPINSQRVDAFNRVMENYPDINILASQTTNWNPQQALSVTEDLLGSNPEVDAIWAGDDDVLISALQAVDENNRDDIQLIVGGGGSQRVIEMIRDEHPMVKGTVTYPPNMIASAMALAVHGVKGEHLGDMYHGVPSRLILNADLITLDNVEEYYEPEAAY
ncbi:Ribose ABC transporter, periplasmic ribose-binding protein RbsB (TC 3.A.1.2.1) [Halomonas citrativorans]|uniref:Ribose ABC transporter, periplasmic ribose-binding protein RbsB (TC 3.A.1.2.1) n=1 Tax=Halomonas citrativorans TaxID=2742612 RepID=A0A1R4I3T3_9GAMM|nr:substrate-binding domain-containing protein [Halomonas citrativorans]SJN14428.1 Ribose ABC transporter, periplasmic ribose-binding protein RbsB (TC 3.A.1.2.1) [Halomonas citrativorans]